MLESSETADSVVSVAPVAQHPSYMLKPAGDGRLETLVPIGEIPERRQDLPPIYAINCAIMLSRLSYLRRASKEGLQVTNLADFAPMFMSSPNTLDINSEMDFQFAEFLFERMARARDT